jgi:hypothetical protein
VDFAVVVFPKEQEMALQEPGTAIISIMAIAVVVDC